MSPASRSRIIEAWFGPFTRGYIARRHHTSARTVGDVWAAAQAAGTLPRGCRPHFQAVSALPVPRVCALAGNDPASVDAGADLALDREVELAEQFAEQSGLRIPARDQLLDRLRAAHGDDPRRVIDARIAAGCAMTDAGRRRPCPTSASCAALAALTDRTMRRAAAGVRP